MAVGFVTGLARLGVELPESASALVPWHGAFMIAGFLGTLISLERAIALGRPWAYGAPALSSAGALALFAGAPAAAGATFLLASVILLLATCAIAVRHVALFTVALALGAACWTAGTLAWLAGHSGPEIAGWWLDFLLLTVAAERLELSRIVNPSRASHIVFAAAVALVLAGAARGELAGVSAPFTAVGLLACAAWLARHDVARRIIRQAGQPRFSAVAILAGHAWIAIAGIVLLIWPPGSRPFSYDATVHAIAIGFVLSMVFGHAPIILPAVTGLRPRISTACYAPLALLHLSAIIRVGGDLLAWTNVRAASGVLTVLALAGYAGLLIAGAAASLLKREA